jgi:hypothetical protein
MNHKKFNNIFLFLEMNPAVLISSVVAVLSVGSANAFFGADIITATGTSSGLGTSVILASGAGVPAAAAVIGAGLLLKAGALLLISQSRSKRSTEEDTDAIFTTIAAAEPASCVKQLICDIATGTHPSENDIILSLFESETPVTSPKFDFAVAATLGKQLKSVEACELRYTCPVKL